MFNAEFWVAFAFLIFFGLIAKYCRKSIFAVLDARTDKIGRQIEEAKILHDEAKAILDNIIAKKNNALLESQAIIAAANHEGELMIISSGNELDQHLQYKKQRARIQVLEYEKAALRQYYHLVVELAVSVAASCIARTDSLRNDPVLFSYFTKKLEHTDGLSK